MYKTPVVYWKSEWVVLKNKFVKKFDKDTNTYIEVPKILLIGVKNKEYFTKNQGDN